MDKQAAWETLKQQTVERFGPGTVFGEGSLDARLTIVGEAPGQQEVEAGRPFVGRAGRLLDQVLEAAGIDRSRIYVTNTVKVRPTTEKGGRLKNRPPRAGEIRAGLEVLLPELRLVASSILVLLGNVPAKALINRSFAMGSDRGVWFETELGARYRYLPPRLFAPPERHRFRPDAGPRGERPRRGVGTRSARRRRRLISGSGSFQRRGAAALCAPGKAGM